jgi:hypothetical protein
MPAPRWRRRAELSEAARGVDSAAKLGTGAMRLPQVEVQRSKGCRDGLLARLEASAQQQVRGSRVAAQRGAVGTVPDDAHTGEIKAGR